MRTLPCAALFVTLALSTPGAAADLPPVPVTTLVVRNVGAHAARVQVAVGFNLPCDSSDNQMVIDERLAPGETRSVPVYGVAACARHTSSWGDIDFGTERWVYGGFRCVRHGPCHPDPSVMMRYDFSAP